MQNICFRRFLKSTLVNWRNAKTNFKQWQHLLLQFLLWSFPFLIDILYAQDVCSRSTSITEYCHSFASLTAVFFSEDIFTFGRHFLFLLFHRKCRMDILNIAQVRYNLEINLKTASSNLPEYSRNKKKFFFVIWSNFFS